MKQSQRWNTQDLTTDDSDLVQHANAQPRRRIEVTVIIWDIPVYISE